MTYKYNLETTLLCFGFLSDFSIPSHSPKSAHGSLYYIATKHRKTALIKTILLNEKEGEKGEWYKGQANLDYFECINKSYVLQQYTTMHDSVLKPFALQNKWYLDSFCGLYSIVDTVRWLAVQVILNPLVFMDFEHTFKKWNHFSNHSIVYYYTVQSIV